MSDLVKRLRNHALPDPYDEREVMHAPLLREAADEIESLRQQLTECDRERDELKQWLEDQVCEAKDFAYKLESKTIELATVTKERDELAHDWAEECKKGAENALIRAKHEALLAKIDGLEPVDWDINSMDAAVWAKAFAERFTVWSQAHGVESDTFGLMVGWFANAIMAGYDEATRRHPAPAVPESVEPVAENIDPVKKLVDGLKQLAESCQRGKFKRDINTAVDRFLSWKLPEDFHPDCGIDFKPLGKPHPEALWELWPVGTNLFTAEQAKTMFEHCLEGTGYVLYPSADAVEAARYLFFVEHLADDAEDNPIMHALLDKIGNRVPTKEELDAAIDAAMKKENSDE